MEKMKLKKSLWTGVSAVAFVAAAALPTGASAALQTISAGAAVNNGDFVNFTADVTGTVADGEALGNNGGVSATTATTNTGTLTFAGDSTTPGSIGGSSLLLKVVNGGIASKLAVFSGDVYATTANVTGTGGVTFNGNYTGTTLNYAADGTVILATTKNITAAIATATTNTGTLTISGTSTVSGNVGATGLLLKKISAGAATKTATFSGNVFATTLAATGTGTIALGGNFTGTSLNFANNAATMTLASGKTVTGTIDSTAGSAGIFTFLGSGTVTGNVGATNAITTLNVGLGTVATQGTVAAKTVAFAGDNALTIATTKSLTSATAITTATTNTGTLTFSGTSTGSLANVGGVALKLKLVTIGTGTVTSSGDVYATTVNFAGDGGLTLSGDKALTAAITTSTTNTGTLTHSGTGTVTGQVGTSSAKLKVVSGGAAGKTATFANDVYATTATVANTGTVAFSGNFSGTTLNYAGDGIASIADGKNITAAITTATTNTGTLTVSGTTTVSGDIGNSTTPLRLKLVSAGANTKTATFTGVVNATTLSATGTGTIALNGGFNGTTVQFANNAATITLASGKTVTGAIDSSGGAAGIFTFLGSGTVTGNVGAANAITTLNVGLGTVTTKGGVTAKTVAFAGDNVLSIATTKTLTSATAITTAGSSSGTLTFLGSGAGSLAEVGTTTNKLKLVTINTGTVAASGNVYATAVNFADDGALTLSGDKNLVATVTSTTTNTGTVTMSGTGSVTGQLGTSSAVLKKVKSGANGKTVTFNNDIYATDLASTGTGTTVFADGVDLSGTVTATGAGTLTLSGASTIGGAVAVTGARLGTINVDTLTAKTVHFGGDTWTATFDATGSNAMIEIAKAKTITATNAITAPLAGSATYAFEVDETAGNAAKLASDGAITLTNARLQINVAATSKTITDGTVYTIVSGTAATGPTNTTILDNSYIYDFTYADAGATLTATSTTAHSLASVSTAVAGAGTVLQSLGTTATGELASAIGAALSATSEEAARKAIESTAPTLEGVGAASISVQNAALGTVETRLASLRNGTEGVATGSRGDSHAAWGQVFGSSVDQDVRHNVSGYQADTVGMAIGTDRELDSQHRLGFALSMANTKVDSDVNNSTKNVVNSYQLTAYGSHDEGQWYSDLMVSGAYNNYDSKRGIAGVSSVAVADYSGWQGSVKMGGGYRLPTWAGFQLTPTASLQYTYLAIDSYKETGAGTANLTVKNDDNNALESALGARVSYPFMAGGYKYVPELRAEWLYDITGDEQTAVNTFQGGGAAFKTKAAAIARNKFRGGAGLTMFTQDNMSIRADYDIELKEQYEAHAGQVKVRFTF